MTSLTTTDVAVAALLVWMGRIGYSRGIAEMIWPLTRWVMVAVVSVLACVPLGSAVARVTGLSPSLSLVLAYLTAAIGMVLLVGCVCQRVSGQLSVMLSLGEADQFLGAVAGVLSAAALCIIGCALLHPVRGTALDWDPGRMSGEEAMTALIKVIAGTLRRIILDESRVGPLVQEYLSGLLIPTQA